MTKQTEAMKLALDAFETLTQYNMVRANIFRQFHPTATGDYVDLQEFREKVKPAITALREALAEQPAEANEPVAYIEHHKAGDNLMWDNPGANSSPLYTSPPTLSLAQQEPEYWLWACGQHIQVSLKKPEFPDAIPLYTRPQAREPLTDEVKDKFWMEAIKHGLNGQSMNWQKAADFYAHAIEAAHGIGVDK